MSKFAKVQTASAKPWVEQTPCFRAGAFSLIVGVVLGCGDSSPGSADEAVNGAMASTEGTGSPGRSIDRLRMEGGGSDSVLSNPALTPETDDEELSAAIDTDYYPMTDGAVWRYQHVGWVEEITATQIEFEEEVAFIVSDSPNPSDDLQSDSILTKREGRWLRIAKEVFLSTPTGDILDSSSDYGVGFTRFNDAWVTSGVGFAETPSYERVETPGTLEENSPEAEARRHTFEVVAIDQIVETPAGTFNCIEIKRTKDWQADLGNDPQVKRFWFAPGVGKVREFNEGNGNTEFLLEFSLP